MLHSRQTFWVYLFVGKFVVCLISSAIECGSGNSTRNKARRKEEIPSYTYAHSTLSSNAEFGREGWIKSFRKKRFPFPVATSKYRLPTHCDQEERWYHFLKLSNASTVLIKIFPEKRCTKFVRFPSDPKQNDNITISGDVGFVVLLGIFWKLT